jgi:hypothetical protein
MLVFAFFALMALIGVRSPNHTPVLIAGVACAVGLVVIGRLASYQKKRDLNAHQTLMDNLHRPNEAVALVVLNYATWGLLAVAALGVANGLAIGKQPYELLGFGALIPCAAVTGYLGKMMRGPGDDWLSTRLRLTGITHRSVEFVLLAKANTSSGPIQVQTEYLRTLLSINNRRNDRTSSELIWRSPAVAMEPVYLPDRTEFRARIAMPADFPRPLAPESDAWVRRWNIKIRPSPERTLNFDFRVPVTIAPDA